jgi:hypothetical protein
MSDLLLNSDFDLQITNGDFATGDSKRQEADLIMRANAGDYKRSPVVGVNLIDIINDEYINLQQLKVTVANQMKYDGKKLKTFAVTGNNINIEVE